MKQGSWAVFSGFFLLYLRTMSPSLAAYRDTGEMALGAHTLGVMHPPSYPLYALLGRLADLLALGNNAYGLALVSALAGAGALALVLRILAARCGLWPAAGAVVLLGTNFTFWTVSTVQEMYSLTLLLAVILLMLAMRLRGHFELRCWFLSAFLLGLFLGNRTDLLLWCPGFVVLAFPADFSRWETDRRGRFLLGTAGFGLLGLTVYLYLPLRSMVGPWLDWNHPASLANFIGSLTRSKYGGTLDLLSKNYATGAMFFPNLIVYGRHLWQNFHLVGLVLTAAGLFDTYRTDRRRFAGELILYAVSGPLFLFLANLPPNPHAMAIVEPHYLLSDLLVTLWVAAGCASLARTRIPRWAPTVAAGVLILQPWMLGRLGEMDRRWDMIAYDYAGNVMRSTPPGSILLAKKDVQLFSLWYYHRLRGKRPDLHILPQGLAHSDWFQASQHRFGSPVRVRELKTTEGMLALVRDNPPPVYATMAFEFPDGLRLGTAHGLVYEVAPGHGREFPPPTQLPWEFIVRRGDYRYEHRPEFFTSDLIGDYAAARQRLGNARAQTGAFVPAVRDLTAAWAMQWRQPGVATFLGYVHFRSGDLDKALAAYSLADKLYDETLALTREYYSLPGAVSAYKLQSADNALNLGVVYEKKGDAANAERSYRKALLYDPKKAQAYFNIGVLYWRKDWGKALEALEAVVRLDPNHAEALKFLPGARAGLARQRQGTVGTP